MVTNYEFLRREPNGSLASSCRRGRVDPPLGRSSGQIDPAGRAQVIPVRHAADAGFCRGGSNRQGRPIEPFEFTGGSVRKDIVVTKTTQREGWWFGTIHAVQR